MHVTEVSFGAVRSLARAARREGVTLRDLPPLESVASSDPEVTWFAAFDERRVVACGYVRRLPLRARLGGCFVLPEFRGRGLGEELVRVRFDVARGAADVVDVFAFRSRLFLKLGFAPRRTFKLGTTHLEWRR